MPLKFRLVALALTAVAAPGIAETDTRADAPVLATIQAFSDARNGFDAMALGALLTPDYIEISPRGEIDRREAVLGFYAADKASPVPAMVLTTQDVRRYGDTAIVIGSVDYSMKAPNGANLTRTVRVTYVERRIGGRWLLASTHYTGVQLPHP